MAHIRSFKGIRPVRSKVHLVATRPYYSYKKNVLKAKLEDNPFTFLHIINPEFGAQIKTKPNSNERFLQVKQKFQLFLDEGILMTDAQEQLYIYRQSRDGMVVSGFFAGVSVDDYLNGQIKIHEQTLTAREDVFTNYLDIVGFNAEPVLLTYEGQKPIQEILNTYLKSRPEYEFTTTDRITHEVWLLNPTDTQIVCAAFEKVPAFYIADGHHRSASSARYTQQLRAKNESYPDAANYFLGYLVDEKEVQISAFHRLLKSTNGLDLKGLMGILSNEGSVEKLAGPQLPEKKHDIHIYMDQTWLKFRPNLHFINDQDPIETLDSFILSDLILKPIFGIIDLKTSDQVEFVPGIEPLQKIIDTIDAKKFEVAFLLHPASIEDVKKVADAGLNMPPKSTWVEPKLRSGLTIYSLES
ncbi:MAG: hypothetical protein RLZZ211_1758 [Bacteroidota bacterium]|jgi:uncharacterized protein (DUF1015 family)